MPVFATQGTWDAHQMPDLPNPVSFKAGENIRLNGFEVQAFRVTHDAGEPVGYIISDSQRRTAIATDLGCGNALVQERLKGADLVILESNHDVDMLRDRTVSLAAQAEDPWQIRPSFQS